MLKQQANEIRKSIIEMLYHAKSGHPGGSLSCVEILTVLYHKEMQLKRDEHNRKIDYCILSKGHAAPALYATLASVGILEKELLNTVRKVDSILEGHPSNKIPGVDVSSGSLGQGLSVASGIALAKKIDKQQGQVYVILGDGEMEEGQIWEALMTVHKYQLSNLTIFIDHNGLQIDGTIEQVKKVTHLEEKLTAFGMNVIVCNNGNNLGEIDTCIQMAKEAKNPTCIIANTIKGKGVSFMENQVAWHGKAMSDQEYEQAMQELSQEEEKNEIN